MLDIKNSRIYQFVRKTVKTYEYSNDTRKMRIDANRKKIFIMGGIITGNIGDIAITVSEYTLLKDLTNCALYVITEPQFRWAKDEVIKMVNDDDLIIITGGGFLGTDYPIMETFVRSVISSFPQNKIIVFPQTMHYDHFDEKVNKVYCHNDLTILCRDQGTINYISKFFPSTVKTISAPDVVTYMNLERLGIKKEISKGNKALMIFREDSEKAVPDSCIKLVEEVLEINNYQITKYNTKTTIISKDIDSMRKVVKDTVSFISQFDVVFTDRLHGMILAAISNTRCIAFDNITKKISGVYRYIKDENPQIRLINPYDNNIKQQISSFIVNPLDKVEYHNERIIKEFKRLIKKLQIE